MGSSSWACAREQRSEEHTSELQSHSDLVCRLLLEKKKILACWCQPRHAFPFTVPPTTHTYPLSLHDALPIFGLPRPFAARPGWALAAAPPGNPAPGPAVGRSLPRAVLRHQWVPAPGLVHENRDRKSTRLNSSHTVISYAVFCLKKKKY